MPVNRYGPLHCWKAAAKAYEKAIAVSDTPEARKALASALEMMGVEEAALLTKLRSEVHSELQNCNANTMAQHVVNISALKESLSQGDKADGFVEELKCGIALAEKITGIEAEINKAKVENRNEDAVCSINEVLKLLPSQSPTYAQYKNDLKKLSRFTPLSKKQAANIDAKKCVWQITPSKSEATGEDGLIRLKVISVKPGYEATNNICNICANIQPGILAFHGSDSCATSLD